MDTIVGVMPTRFRLKAILDERAAAGKPMSLRALAMSAGVSYTTAHGIYSNRTRQVHLDTLNALARELGVAPGDLLWDTPDKPKKSR